MKDQCWFCHGALFGKTNGHHLIPQRYFPEGRDTGAKGNIVATHISCHEQFNREFDRLLPLSTYVRYMSRIDWGYGIYSG